MRILSLQPYFGGSHRAFSDGWRSRSRHDWSLLSLPPHKWKWRMRHAPLTFARQATELLERESIDALATTDMLNLPEFLGLCPTAARMPSVVYFHENQLTYPVRQEDERDLHFAFTNFHTAAAADAVWFNSAFHRDAFFDAMKNLIRKMPDYQPLNELAALRGRAEVRPPGIELPPPGDATRRPGPLRILWAARWEHDKNPETFFEAMDALADRGINFRLSVLGESFKDRPVVFEVARKRHADLIDHWGFLESREAYLAALAEADVVVSTALHEFFGLAVVEAIAAGTYPLLPDRLAYPEVLDVAADPSRREFFYDGNATTLADRLADLAGRLSDGDLWQGDPNRIRRIVERFCWQRVAAEMDDAIEALV
jgi:glycosyltransferase involved in cell wall biosynthesis